MLKGASKNAFALSESPGIPIEYFISAGAFLASARIGSSGANLETMRTVYFSPAQDTLYALVQQVAPRFTTATTARLSPLLDELAKVEQFRPGDVISLSLSEISQQVFVLVTLLKMTKPQVHVIVILDSIVNENLLGEFVSIGINGLFYPDTPLNEVVLSLDRILENNETVIPESLKQRLIGECELRTRCS